MPCVSGTYRTLVLRGTIQFTPFRRVPDSGYEGRFVIDGKTYPASIYHPRTGGVGLVWFYGTSGIMAGNTLGSMQADGSYAGPLWLFDQRGNTTDSGTARIDVAVR